MAILRIYIKSNEISKITSNYGTLERQTGWNNTCKFDDGTSYEANARYQWDNITSTDGATLTFTGINKGGLYGAEQRTDTFKAIPSTSTTTNNTITFTINGNITSTVNFLAVNPTAGIGTTKGKVSITGYITNATCNYSNDEEVNTSKKIIIKANNGYEFIRSTYTYLTEGATTNFTISNDKTTLTSDVLDESKNYTLNSGYNASEKAPSGDGILTITGTIKNATCNYSNGENMNSNKPIIITADSGFTFQNENYSYIYTNDDGEDITEDFIISSDKTTLTSQHISNYLNYTLNDNYIATGGTPTPTPTKGKVYITGSIENATCNYINGENVDTSKPLRIKPNEGYNFQGAYTYETYDGTNTLETFSDGSIGISSMLGDYDYTLNDNYIATKTSIDNYQFTHIYKITTNELNQLARQRFVEIGGTDSDLGVFITSLAIFRTPIPNDIIGDSEMLQFGNRSTTVQGKAILKHEYNIDYGKITVPEKYKNTYDYKNVDCYLFVPFFNPIQIETQFVIGQSLSISLNVNFYSNKGTIEIKSTFSDGYTITQDTNIVDKIPFIQQLQGAINSEYDSNHFNLINKAYIIITRPKPYNSTDFFGRETILQDLIGNQTGYTQANIIKIETLATQEEQDKIKELIANGIYI